MAPTRPMKWPKAKSPEATLRTLRAPGKKTRQQEARGAPDDLPEVHGHGAKARAPMDDSV